MLRQLSFYAALATASVGSLTAHIHPNAGEWGFAGEFLYFYPSVDDTYFVLKTNDGEGLSGHWINNDFNFVPGFRIEGAYTLCGCEQEILISYARVSTNHSKTITGSGLSATAGSASVLDNSEAFSNYTGAAQSIEDTLYQRGEVLLEWKIWRCCPFDFYLLAGVQGAYLRLHENLYYTTPAGSTGGIETYKVEQRPRTWGLGPEFGVEFNQDIWDVRSCYCRGTLSVVGLATASVLACEVQPLFRAQDAFATSFQNINPQHTWKLVPSLQARLGLAYHTSICGFCTVWEVGYELTTYIRALGRPILQNSAHAESLSQLNYSNYDIQGLYASFGGSF